MMKKNLTISCALILLLFLSASAWAVGMTYSGSLAIPPVAGIELDGTGQWATGNASLGWTVSWDTDVSSLVHYEYVLSHLPGETSHFILEVSDDFTLRDIFNANGGVTGPDNYNSTDQGNSNPGMPGNIYGIKFDETTGTTTTVSFDSTRLPVWGDFYAKSGRTGGLGFNALWNVGLTAGEDDDPLDPPSDGTNAMHILVPNGVIPEPVSLLLIGSGLVGLAAFKRKKVKF